MSADSLRKRFSLFNKKKQPEELPPDLTFDESSFDFCLKGGPYQTSLIEASATLKKGKCKGSPLPLRCTWYRSARESDFVVIEGISGAFYQPTADDVGCKICVHALPVSEVQEYTGMPAFAEVGPLQLDPALKRTVQDFLLNGATFAVTVLSGLSETSTPMNAQISFSKDAVVIGDGGHPSLAKFTVTHSYPQVLVDYRSNCLLRILLDESSQVDVSCLDSVQRDTVTLTARMFSGSKVAADQTDVFLKLQQLNGSLVAVSKERELLATQLSGSKQCLEEALHTRDESQTKLQKLQTDHGLLLMKTKENETELETQRQEVKFLRQDLNVYKNQCAALELKLTASNEALSQIKQLTCRTVDQLEQLVKRLGRGGAGVGCEAVYDTSEQGLMLTDSLTSVAHNLQSFACNEISWSKDSSIKSARTSEEESSEGPNITEDRHQAEIAELKEALSKKEEEFEAFKAEMTEQLGKAQAEKNFYRRKAESIVQENEKLLSKLGKNPKEITAFELSKQEFEAERRRLTTDKEEAEAQMKLYLKLMESTERKLADETRRNEELRIMVSRRPRADSKEFSFIINSLTQTLTEREEELGAQKEINRTLMKRLSELQAAVAVGCEA
jgi:hypothetical protein